MNLHLLLPSFALCLSLGCATMADLKKAEEASIARDAKIYADLMEMARAYNLHLEMLHQLKEGRVIP